MCSCKFYLLFEYLEVGAISASEDKIWTCSVRPGTDRSAVDGSDMGAEVNEAIKIWRLRFLVTRRELATLYVHKHYVADDMFRKIDLSQWWSKRMLPR
jgi:hypothetical protein